MVMIFISKYWKKTNKTKLRYMFLIAFLLSAIYIGKHAFITSKSYFRFYKNQQHSLDSLKNTTSRKSDRNEPLIFIGGMPRSGTTLMRVLLDTHPDVRCGEETRIIPRLLDLRHNIDRSVLEKQRLAEAGVTDSVFDSAMSSFILEIITKHRPIAPRLCNKDPFALKSTLLLHRLFPASKFVLMIRDGRAVVHSIIFRNISVYGYNTSDFRDCLKHWNTAMETMLTQCMRLGSQHCMPVYYERLVLRPKITMINVFNFLNITWTSRVLHHQDYINQNSKITLSMAEKSTDQVIKPINYAPLTQWVPYIPSDVRRDMATVAPMLSKLGYDPFANPPNYGKPDTLVHENTLNIYRNFDYWEKRSNEIIQERNKLVDKVGN